MATLLRVLRPANSDVLADAQGILDDADRAEKSSTSVTYIDDDSARSVLLQGTDFDFQQIGPQIVPFGAQVLPKAGTVTSLSIFHGNVKVADLTGFHADLTFVAASLQSGTVQGFLDSLQTLQGPISFHGNNGRDILPGTLGDDTYDGGPRGDTFNGGDGVDTVSYFSSKAGITASLAQPGTNTGDAARDVYHDIENLAGSKFRDHLSGDGGDNRLNGAGSLDVVLGGAGDDSVSGALGNDRLYGNTGDDSLAGGRGADLLVGGAGADSFVFNNLSEGVDKVAAFDGQDSVLILREGFGLDAQSQVDFVASNNPHASSDHPTFLYDVNDKNFLFDPDGNKGLKATLLFHITGAGAVQESDIHFL